jgi:hypothetical protein
MEITAAPPKTHAHKFEVKNGTGVCLCGETRKYHESDNLRDCGFTLIKHGDPNYKDSAGNPNNKDSVGMATPVAQPVAKPVGAAPVAQPKPVEKLPETLTEAIGKSTAAPKKPAKRKDIWKFFDDNKEAMLDDYKTMTQLHFLDKWCSTTTWMKLKKRWGVENKNHPRKAKPASDKVLQIVPEAGKSESKPTDPTAEVAKILKVKPKSDDYLLSRLIQYWKDKLIKNTTSVPAEKTIIEMTIGCLEELAK